jgi:hypothetical protein
MKRTFQNELITGIHIDPNDAPTIQRESPSQFFAHTSPPISIGTDAPGTSIEGENTNTKSIDPPRTLLSAPSEVVPETHASLRPSHTVLKPATMDSNLFNDITGYCSLIGALMFATNTAACHVESSTQFVGNLGLRKRLPPTLFIENQSATRITQHIAKHHHCEKYETGLLEPEYIPSSENSADIFTKSFPATTFDKQRLILGMLEQGEC